LSTLQAKHIASFADEHASLPGDPSKPAAAYGPAVAAAKEADKDADDEDDIDLFGSDDDEEEDAEAVRIREERLAEYKKKKEGKTVSRWSLLLTFFSLDLESDN
jgi:elongation factor 1-beta